MIIGIGGVSRSGKSYLAGQLSQLIIQSGKSVKVLDQDDFVFPEDQIPTIRDHIDWECPESIDFQRFKQSIIEASSENDFVIVEGLMVFREPEIFNLLDYKIHIELNREEFISRKQTDLRWGKEPEWYIDHIWNGYLQYGQFPEPYQPDLRLDGAHVFNLDELHQKIFPDLLIS